MKQTVLHTSSLAIGYVSKKKPTVVLEHINLEIKEGSFVAILGRNGVGKSTLIRTLTQVQPPLSGSVCIHQKALDTYSYLDFAKEVSLVLTERLPESQLTVYELVALGRQPYTNWVDQLTEVDRNAIDRAIALTEIAHLTHKRFYELSDGQLQRVLIARALAQDTAIIILDEPTAHLDLHHTLHIFNLLKTLVSSTGKTIIISTHQVNLAIELSDELVLLSENNIQVGSKNELIASNAFDTLFPKKLINFDSSLKQFVIRSENTP